MEKNKIKEAIDLYGYEIVNSVIEMADSQGEKSAYEFLVKSGKSIYAECILKLYIIKND
jgi:hypothetical protein